MPFKTQKLRSPNERPAREKLFLATGTIHEVSEEGTSALEVQYFMPCALSLLSLPSLLAAQTAVPAGNNISLSGQVVDPSGALIPGATITLTRGATVLTATSASDGRYQFRNISPGTYQLTVEAVGFAPLTMPSLSLSATRQLSLPLKIAAEQEQVTVTTQAAGLSVNSDENANSTVQSGQRHRCAVGRS